MHLIVDTHIGSITAEEYYPVILKLNDKSAKKQVECRYYKTNAQLNTFAVIFVGELEEDGIAIETIISKTVAYAYK